MRFSVKWNIGRTLKQVEAQFEKYDPVLTAALVGRLTHKAHLINMSGYDNNMVM